MERPVVLSNAIFSLSFLDLKSFIFTCTSHKEWMAFSFHFALLGRRERYFFFSFHFSIVQNPLSLDTGGGVQEPLILADEICEQPLSIIKHEYILTWSYIKNNVCTFYSMRALDHANCSQKLTRGEGGSAKSWHLLTEGGGAYEPPFLAHEICEQPLSIIKH